MDLRRMTSNTVLLAGLQESMRYGQRTCHAPAAELDLNSRSMLVVRGRSASDFS